MTKEEIYKEVEKDLLTHFDAKVLMPMHERLAVIIMESTIKAINYTHCCKSDSEQLPNIYEGALSNDRIKVIRTLADNYNISIDAIRSVFNDGADFYKQTLTK